MQRKLGRRAIAVGLTALALAVAGAPGDAHAQKKGGVLKIGNLGEPPSLDPHWGTQTITEVLSNHIYEGLYSLDASYRPIPMLAESLPQVSADGLTYTIKLRPGIKFHNGKEMTSDDVVASIRRWSQRAVYGKALFAQVADFRAVDRHTVELKLKEKSAIVVVSLAVPNNFGAIYPKEVAEKFPPDQRITEFIGTGPFKLAEWKPDQYIRMVRFDDYKPRSEARSGYGGAKVAYVDELRWIPVPDAASRAAQVESGDLDFADDLVADAYDRLKANPNVQPIIVKPYYWLVAVFNKKEGLMTSQKLRQAWQAALDIEPIMKTVAGGKSEFYRMDSSLAFQELPDLAHQDRGPALERAQQGQGQAAAQGGRLHGPADPFHDHPGVQVDVRLRAGHQATARGRGLRHRSPGDGLVDARPAPHTVEGVRRLHHRDRERLRSDPPRLSHVRMARLDLRRGHPGPHGAARPGDGPEEAVRALGAADQALLRQGPGGALRRPLRPAGRPQARQGLQRQGRAPSLLGRVDREVGAAAERAGAVPAGAAPAVLA